MQADESRHSFFPLLPLRLALLLLVSVFVSVSGLAHAAANELRIGLKVGPSAIDPHYHASGENSSLLPHIYESLVTLDEDFATQPGLATAWRTIGDLIWEFDLRHGVVFHNGDAFTAEDVRFTLQRVPEVRNSPGSYEIFTKRVSRIEIVNEYRIRFHTEVPRPFLDHDIAGVMIIPRVLGLHVETAEFNSGVAAIGTGPYEFERWAPGQVLSLRRNERYWQGRPDWDRVSLIPINSDPTRVAALLNGEVDLIEQVPLADRQRLYDDKSVVLHEHEAARLMFVHFDSARAASPFITDTAGRPLDRNPLQDVRVRRALSLAIDRQAIIDYLLEGSGTPAAQVLPDSFAGSSPRLSAEHYDPDKARRLLTEAGYPEGFGLTLHSPSGRYPNDSRIVQAIAQMWWRVNVITEVVTLTPNVFFPTAAKQEFSAYFSGWGETTVANALAGLAHSYDKKKGFGNGNRARFSNAEVDALIEEALSSLDAGHRQSLLARAQEIVFREDQGLVPLYHPVYVWATRSEAVEFSPNAEGVTQAMHVRPLPAAANQ